MDTGAAVTAITEDTYEALQRPKLTPAQKTLCGPARQSLEVLGLFEGNLRFQNRSAQMELYVIKGLKNNLLGLPAITSLSLIEKLCTTEFEDKDTHSIPKEILEQFPEVFKGLGTFREEYKIKIKNDATPFALYAPRNVPIPLWEKVKKGA